MDVQRHRAGTGGPGREGDTLEVTLHNADHHIAHSLIHAAQASPQVAFADVAPGETRTFSFVVERPGVFMYHCGTSPVLQHIGMGMYGAIIVDPAAGRPPANETVLVQSEFYGKVKKGKIRPSYKAMQTRPPTFTAFNGRAFQYRNKPVEIAVGEPQRVYVVAAGPTWAATSTSSARSSTRCSRMATRPTSSPGSRPTTCRGRRGGLRARVRRAGRLPVRHPRVPLG